MNIMAMGRGGLEEVRQQWGWFLALGVLLVVLGVMAAGMAVVTTVVTVVFFGSLLLVSGIAHIINAWRGQGQVSFWLYLLAGVLDVVLGTLLILRPLSGAAVLTLMLAAFLCVGGIYRGAGALSLRFPGWTWSLLSAVIDIALAILLLSGWPVSGLWFLGLCVGLGLIFRGWAWVMTALLLRNDLEEEGAEGE